MSECQYYEFRAVDRPLDDRQMRELRAISSRAVITPTSFTNEYNWGDFKGSPDKWMEKYFDAFLYLANWGTRGLMLRIPKRLLDSDTAATFCAGDSVSNPRMPGSAPAAVLHRPALRRHSANAAGTAAPVPESTASS